MIVTLPQPIRGNTHVRVEEVAQFGAQQIRVRLQGGTMSTGDPLATPPVQPEFQPDTDLAPAERYVRSDQMVDFNAHYAADTWLGIGTLPPLEVHARKILRFIWGGEAALRGVDPTLPA